MDNVLIAIICIALIFFVALTVADISLSAKDDVATAWKQMEQTARERAKTGISSLTASTSDGVTVDVTLDNDGETKIEDFDKWDVILQYQDTIDDLYITRMGYNSSGPGALNNNEWAVEGIYLDINSGTPEAFDIGILNPTEDMRIRMKVSPGIGAPSTSRVSISTANGVLTSIHLVR